jgi:DNA-binding MarR family transcriptional regulator/N-acetylglutamate synthase-like GNAT family acetyltransferase
MARTMSDTSDQLDAVHRFHRFWAQRIDGVWDRTSNSDLSRTQARVLRSLGDPANGTPTRLAAELGLDPGYLSRVVGGLERRGLVVRSSAAEDRRVSHLRLTSAGRRAFQRLDSVARRRMGDLLSGASPEQCDRVVEAMRSIEAELVGSGTAESVTYRTHRPGDMGWIVQRHGELYHASHGWDATFEAMVAGIACRFLERYDPTCERSWIAEVDGRRAGAIALVRHTRTIGQLRLLFVEPWARGLGIGRYLVSACVAEARHVGYRKMILFTVAGLDAARHLYEEAGFRLVREHAAHAWGKDHMEQSWELKL